MANKTPIRAVFNDAGTATGLSEFQSGDTVGLTHGGLGASLSLGTAGQVDRPFGLWKAGRLGESGNITTTGTNNMRMVVSASAGLSGTTLNNIVSNNVFNAVANGKTGNAVFILYPSSSDARLTGIPSSIAESYNPGSPVVGQYVVEYANPNNRSYNFIKYSKLCIRFRWSWVYSK